MLSEGERKSQDLVGVSRYRSGLDDTQVRTLRGVVHSGERPINFPDLARRCTASGFFVMARS